MSEPRRDYAWETSFYMIKPHGLVFLEEVKEMIRNGSLIITETKRLVMPHWALEIIYSDLPERYRNSVFKPYVDAYVEAGLVVGKDSINTLLKIAGKELNPIDCAPESIRFKLGTPEPLMIDNVRYYKNIIHRSSNSTEAKKDIGVFRMI